MKLFNFKNLKLLNFALLFCALGFALYASSAYAQGGLVPCGWAGKPCTTCDFMVLANNIITFLFKYIIAPLAALGILASGIVLLTAGGSQTQLETGKKMLWNIVIGFFIAISAWLVVSTILAHLVPGADLPATWNPLTSSFPGCSAQSTEAYEAFFRE